MMSSAPPLPGPADPLSPRLRLRIYFGDEAMFGPGKAELLERIRDSGSISAAGRQMDMSYKRAWGLVEEMNEAFIAPLVESTRGGPKGGGARLTDAGAEVLRRYRSVEAITATATRDDVAALRAMLHATSAATVPDGE